MRDVKISFESSALATNVHEHVVLIASDLTGSSRAAAFAYAKRGNYIILASENDEAAEHLARELRGRNVHAAVVHADTHDKSQMRRLVDETEKYYGHIDVTYQQ
jgi:NAD(P)-dependent dehydrogenase (short-subunit alcohol dehydrogenase family)